MIPRANFPPVQEARRALGCAVAPGTQKVHSLLPPPTERLEQRPVVYDQWGRMSLAGLGDDRLVVPEEPARDLATPVACAVLGFLLFGFANKRT